MRRTTVEIPTRILVLGMAHRDGVILAEEVLPVAEACSLSAEQVRSCLRRLVAEGLFTREGGGRRARFRATAAGHEALASSSRRLRRAFRLDAGEAWDGRWHLAAFAVPEARRAARDALRERLTALGGAALQGGLYVSPHPWEPELASAAKEIGVEGHLTLATTTDLESGGVREPRLLAARLWPVEALHDDYRAFVERYAAVPDALESLRERGEPLPDAAFLPGALRMAVDHQACFERDPLLPAELLPRPWPGTEARELLGRSRHLALALRTAGGRPPLFQLYDDTLAAGAWRPRAGPGGGP